MNNTNINSTNLPIKVDITYNVTTYKDGNAYRGFQSNNHAKATIMLNAHRASFPSLFTHLKPSFKYIYHETN